ncbi:MAG: hypothetical protein DIZ80_05615 [endosymbiont of Galathealinum brachiosum]|uniref:YhdP central domain-containing protein n=1 Tax=endosymbiont of Galathealinum brachiosum TaxID=2200906 RepID=A0A370DJ91_9GAMM|nr:MAG: hypothetical protein DIZ80_05615 [endosymbiont of Galathealinum brachiosum]
MPGHSSKKIRKKKKISLRRLKNWLLSIVGLIVIILAISFTLIRVAIKSIPDYSAAIQQAVSEQMDMTLEVGFLDAEIYWLVPRLNLIDVNVSDKTGKHHLLHLDEIDLSLDWAESIKNMMPVIGEITLTGLNVQLGINKKSQLLIQNYVIDENIDKTLNISSHENVQNEIEISDTVKNNLNNLNFKILNSQVRIYDDRNESRSTTLTSFNLQLINAGDSHTFEVKANLPLNYGEYIHFIVDTEGDLFDYRNLDGNLYLALEGINAASWLDDYWSELKVTANANLHGEVWLQWSGQEITEVNSRVNISDLAVLYLDESVNSWNINQLDALMHWKKINNDWQLDVRNLVVDRDGITFLKPAAATLEMDDESQEIRLRADFLRIDGFVYLAGMINSVAEYNITWLDLLDKYKPSGDLTNIDVQLPVNNLQKIKINTEFSQIGFSLPDAEPVKIENLQGKIDYLDNKTWLTLDSNDTVIKFNELFRNSIDLKVLKGTLELSHQNQLWEVSTQSLIINTPHIETELRLNFNMPDNGNAFLDLTTQFKNGDAKAVDKYLPAGIMGKNAVAWLDAALLDGNIVNGGYQFYGYLNDAPFREHQGISLADFNVTGVDLTYLKNWPEVNDISANIRFENDTMFIDASKGRLFDSKIIGTTVYIDNFISPTLDVKARVNVDLPDIKKYVNGSGLREDVTDYIDNMQLAGKGKLDLELFLPLYGDYYTEVGGKLAIEKGKLHLVQENYKLNNINGLIRFAGNTVESSDLTAEMTGNLPDQLLDIDIKTKRFSEGLSYHIGVNGSILASSLFVPLPGIQAYFDGSADWNIGIDIANDKTKKNMAVKVNVASDLDGVTSSLPGPLSKISEAASPIIVDIGVVSKSEINYELSLNNGDRLKLKQFQDKLLISADMESLKGDAVINRLDDIDEPVNIKLEYLDLNKFFKSAEGDPDKTVVNEALSEKSALQKLSSDVISSQSFSPRDLPSFDFYAKKLIWKKSIYEESELKVQESKLGAVIKGFELSGANHMVSGKGSWFTGKNNVSTTKLDIYINVNDLGKVFKNLEISDNLYETSGNINLRWQWDDTPYNFNWEKIKGDGSLKLDDGVLKQLDAGAGRLLGLFNFKTLFSLDFGNQMKDGFKFDKVRGSFSFSDSYIYTDDFEIESKVADMHMKGQLSLANNTIKQIVTVRPHVGASVTLGTAVVAGPAAGGLVYLFQKIFNTDRLSEYQYSVEGNIDEPVVELIRAPETAAEQEEDSDF